MTPPISRRTFLQDSTLLASSLAASTAAGAAPDSAAASPEAKATDGCSTAAGLTIMIGSGSARPTGPIRCRIGTSAPAGSSASQPALDRNVQLLTRQLGPQTGTLEMSVRLGCADGGLLAAGKGSAGFRIGIRGPLDDYRNALIYGSGLDAGLTSSGGLFIGQASAATPGQIKLDVESVELRLSAEPQGDAYKMTLAAYDSAGKMLGQVSREQIPAKQLVGNLALVANFGKPQPRAAKAKKPIQTPGVGQFWFADWRLDGSKLTSHDDRIYGPILFSQYTLSGGVMKLTAQMVPIGIGESQRVRLQLRREGSHEWSTVAEEPIHPQARTATFRIDDWSDTRDVPYRLAYTMVDKQGHQHEHEWLGTVQRDPVDKPTLTVGDVSCNIHAAFPNTHYVHNMAARSIPTCWLSSAISFTRAPAATARSPNRPIWPSSITCANGTCTAGPGASYARPAEPVVAGRSRRLPGKHLGRRGRTAARHAGDGWLRHAGRVGQRRPPHTDLAPSRSVRLDAHQARHQRLLRAAGVWAGELRRDCRPDVQDRARR